MGIVHALWLPCFPWYKFATKIGSRVFIHKSQIVLTLSEYISFVKVDSFKDATSMEQSLLNTLIASLMNKNEVAKTASAFLEANSGIETCSELLKLRNR